MDNRISWQTSRTFRHVAAWILLSLALPCATFAFKSAYTSISLPGNFDSGPEWDPGTHKLTLVSDYVWQGDLNVTKSGEFKFAANSGWAVNWGLGRQEVSSIPTEEWGPLVPGGEENKNNILLKLPSGKYRFVFFEDATKFSVLATNVPAYTSVQLVGNFNGDGAQTNGTMTQTSTKGVWMTTVNLENGATFRVLADGVALGAHSAACAAVEDMPGTLALYGTTEATLATSGGTFVFTADFRSNLLTVVQTATNAFTTVAASADGTFACGTKTPGQNLEDQGGGWWQGDFMVEQDSFTLRFAGRGTNGLTNGRWWGFPAGTTLATLPVSTNLAASDTSAGAATATVTAGPGDYTFRFNIQSGECMIRKRDRGNLLKNPSFEALDSSGNFPADWGIYHGNIAQSDSYDAHSGTNSVVLYTDEGWENLGNIDQRVNLVNLDGMPFLVSASFRCGGTGWHGELVRIIVEWEGISADKPQEEYAEVLHIGPAWQTASLSTTVPGSNVTAHILFKYDGAVPGETLLIDDAFAGIAVSREQNFDAWGPHDDFGPLSPDWSVDSGKTILNAGENVLGGVIICRYIESVGNTKAIVLYNGTSSSINFKNTPYFLQQYDNGSTSPTATIPLTNGSCPARHTWLVTRRFDSSKYPPNSALKAANYCTTNNALTFNGDDVIVLRSGSTNGPVVDRMGQVGINATGSLWSRMATDHTLVRNATVTNGSTDITAPFDLSEWTILEDGNFNSKEINSHAFADPNASSLPSGYSLLLNTNACLSTPSFNGGIGDITFRARAQADPNGGPLTLLVESATDEYASDWTLVASNSIPATQTAFSRYECAVGNDNHTAVRFRHVSDGTTNRVRLDDISIDRHYSIKRNENFADWTDARYRTLGSYSLQQWSVINGFISTNGVANTLAANLPVDQGQVQSPTFPDGVGQVSFDLCRNRTNDAVQVKVETLTDGETEWKEQLSRATLEANKPGLTTNYSVWVYIPSNACVRFSCDGGTAPAILDNIKIATPVLSRNLDFEAFPANTDDQKDPTGYNSYSYNGWTILNTAIYSGTNSYSGNAGVLQNATITSPYIDTIGSLSFAYAMARWGDDKTARLTVEVSTDNTDWTVLTNGLAPAPEWNVFGWRFEEGTSYHYIKIRQTTTKKRILVDEINIGDFTGQPWVDFSVGLKPAYPAADEPFKLTATAYGRNGADVLSVTGYVKYASGGHPNTLEMHYDGSGDWSSAEQAGRRGGNSIIYYATVWYGGFGAVGNIPGYAVTNITTPATTVTVSSVRSGTVWINEINYARLYPADEETDVEFLGLNQDHEFIELCGPAGTNIGNWKIQLAYALPADIAANSNQAVYATYTIKSGTTFPTNDANGYGFYLLADEAVTNADQKLTKLVPRDYPGLEEYYRSHIRDAAGVIRLINNYGGVVQSICYGTALTNDEYTVSLDVKQSTRYNNPNTLSLAGTGGVYSAFAWVTNSATPGAVNAFQALTGSIVTALMPIWHDPNLYVTTKGQGSFFLFDPANACQKDSVQVFYAYETNDFSIYRSLNGTLYHRAQGSGNPWATIEKKGDFPDNYNPTNGEAYFAFESLDNYAYDRRDTMEYVIAASANGYHDTFLGSTGDGVTCQAYESLAEAQDSPFTHYFPFTDVIVITNIAFSSEGEIRIDTEGNDSLDRIEDFHILATTNLTMPMADWDILESPRDFRHEGTNEFDTFTLPLPDGTGRHFAIQPVE